MKSDVSGLSSWSLKTFNCNWWCHFCNYREVINISITFPTMKDTIDRAVKCV